MKTIKFRAWDKRFLKMYTNVYFDNDTHFPRRLQSPQIGSLTFVYFSNCIIMQFTGLLDRNGKEIYEGDIYSYYNTNSGYGDPNQPERNIDKIESIEELYFDETVQWRMYDLEVIGNIYENKELLN